MARDFLHSFAGTPQSLKGPRSGFNLSSTHKTTFRPGLLIPVGCQLVAPGDIVKGKVNACVRALQTFENVPLDDLYCDTYAFYIPFRILWGKWKQFEGENTSSAGVSTSEVVLPYFMPHTIHAMPTADVTSLTTYVAKFYNGDLTGGTSCGSLDSYLGYPVIKYLDSSSYADTYAPACNGLDIVAYYKVWNTFFRDQNVQAPLAGLDTFYNLSSGARWYPWNLFVGAVKTIRGLSLISTGNDYYLNCCPLAPVNKYHDYFTSCLPSPDGTTVYISLGDYAPLGTIDDPYTFTSDGATLSDGTYSGPLYGGESAYLSVDSGTVPSTASVVTQTNVVADLSSVTGISINTLRQSIATQLYYENLQLGGSRYIETRKSIWDETIRNDMIQEPEFLAGDHTLLNIQSVNNTSTANTVAVGKQSANSVSLLRGSNSYIKHVKEFGYIMTFMCVRYKHTYNQGLNRDKMLHRQFDFYNPFFDSIGNTPVYKDEIFVEGSTSSTATFLGDGTVFGYQEAWADYRDGSVRNRVSGAFHPDAGLSDFAAWTFTDDYDSVPSLSGSWMCEDPNNITRCMVGTTYGPWTFGADIDNVCIAYRHMKAYSKPSRLGM